MIDIYNVYIVGILTMRKLLILLIINILPSFLFADAAVDTTGPVSLLYNGAEYVKQFNTAKGDPFFPSAKNAGSVKYQQNWYHNMEVHYDCEDDYVLVRDMRGLLKLRLINEMLDEFFVDEHHFVKKTFNNPSGEFYELIFEGKRTLLVKWMKRLNTDTKNTDTYVLKNNILLIEKGKASQVMQQKDILASAKENAKALKKVLKDNGVSFRKDPIRASKLMIQEMEAKGW
ncbi:MAG: hypothetical protein RLZ76_1707 [Bacteroidota bacterium]